MIINKFETVGILLCVGVMSLALFFMQTNDVARLFTNIDGDTQAASSIVSGEENTAEAKLESDLREAFNGRGELEKLVIDDIVLGEGPEVKNGDTISVHYIGTLQNGQQFDNSHTRGESYEFTVGEGRVIKGWDQGLVGMKKGGQRILVVPPQLAYGANEIGAIPANATLIFSVELLEVKN